MSRSKRLNESLELLAGAEQRFLAGEFLAPACQGGLVQVRLAGVVCRLRIEPADFEGFGVFRPRSYTEAELVRPARMAERQRYLELFPLVRLILTGRHEGWWWAVLAHRGDTRFRIDGPVPVLLVEDAQPFEAVETRFDGSHFWYAGPDARWDPARGAYLRQAQEQEVEPAALHRPGLTAEERAAYALAFQATEKARRLKEEGRLRDALAHAGADLKEWRERDDVYTVTFEVGGERHVSVVAKKDLSVQVAGICLSGGDEAFDLHSLVGVIREARDGGGFVRVGRDNQGMEEGQYWDVHPRRPPAP
jgi:hypothetical protein